MTTPTLVALDDVLALIDAKIDALNRLLENPMCRGMNRQLTAAAIGALVTTKEQLRFIPAAPQLCAA